MSGWRQALRIGLVLTCLAGAGYGGAAPARAAATFSTELSGLPDEFTAGNRVETLSAVVSRSDRADRNDCVKVRWSMLLQVQGLRLDQVKVDRVEETGSFPLEIRTEGDTARLTDRQLDPGVLCPGRTVTAQYRVAFAEDVGRGRVSIAAEAYDPQLRLLARRTASRQVVGEAVEPTPEPSPTSAAPTDPPSEEPPTEEPVTDEPTDAAVVEPPLPGAAGRPVAETGGFGVVQAAFLLGGLLLFLGGGLLLRMRRLLRPAGEPAEEETASFGRRRTVRREWR
ncbi:hypothetical protein O7602_20200 [Micromonospora sp. WMMD1128]|uniref:hypothetical protein n=1 Tax=unclassified Micromonospora TaxID=2617518 RepID=UPI00248B3A18|nr:MULTISPECIES: hypothetical protein [unclassified Micromonospora]WBB72038.1 hypothetical protein O7602_20200 [Micromonospora sp. WMMD1128]WFE34505.1 hypothetical protein O7613_03670 [Micromonospora sp. WMMD975]